MNRTHTPVCLLTVVFAIPFAFSTQLSVAQTAAPSSPAAQSALTPTPAAQSLVDSLAAEQAAVLQTPGVASLEIGDYDLVKTQSHLAVPNVRLGDGRIVELNLWQFDVFPGNAEIVVETPTGQQLVDKPPVALFEGAVSGDPQSRAFLSVSPFGVYGFIQNTAGMSIISSGRFGDGRDTVVFDPSKLPFALDIDRFQCHADELPIVTPQPSDDGGVAVAPPCRILTLALETDYEFTANLFGGNATASAAYAATLTGAVSAIYTRDVNTRLKIGYLRLWTSSADPWDQTASTGAQLDQFVGYWNTNMGGVSRHLAHFLSGRGLGGGVAYLTVICNGQYGYGLSADLGGAFPYPIQNNHGGNWDLMVYAHELGHNFGAPHTHDLTPQVDNCANGDCSISPNGTIMSYCHLCAGGLANVRMEFHPRNINENMLPHLASTCDLTGAPLPGYALNFDGVNDTVRVSGIGADGPTTEITIEFWQSADDSLMRSSFGMNPDQNSNRCQAHVPYSDGKIYWDFGDIASGGRLSYTPPQSVVNSWQHFAFVASQSGNYMRIYRNGVLEAQKTGMTPFVHGNYNLRIGGRSTNVFFNGRIDEVRIWSVARTAAEIAANYAGTLIGTEPGLYGYWRFDEGTGQTAEDVAGTHDGTISGPTWVENQSCAGDLGACCFLSSGTCIDVTQPDCAYFGGLFQGAGTSCATDSCPRLGACCLPADDGICRVMLETECAAQGGTYQGPDTTCDAAGPLNGSALTFSGAGAYARVTGFGAVAPTTEATVEFWQLAERNASQDPFGVSPNPDTNRIQVAGPRTDGSIVWDFGNSTLGGRLSYIPPQPILDTWQHFSFVASESGNYMRIFRNGVLEAEKTGMTRFWPGNFAMRVGNSGAAAFYMGRVDDVRVWNVARTPSQIAANYDRTLNGTETGLVGYWRFDEGAGTTSQDSAGNLPATLFSAGWSQTLICGAEASCEPCDANCDGSTNAFDIEPFVNLLQQLSSPCAPCAGDSNTDGSINGFDIESFVACITG